MTISKTTMDSGFERNGSIYMNIGTCISNSNGDIGYTVSEPFQYAESQEWFIKVIWVDSLLEAGVADELYPNTLSITDERQSDLYT